MQTNEIFNSLFEIIKNRKQSSPQDSYVASLYQGGLEKINRKIMEEAFETTLASSQNKEFLIKEIADLFFHTMVLAAHSNIEINEIEKELAKRLGISGHQEKNQRGKSPL